MVVMYDAISLHIWPDTGLRLFCLIVEAAVVTDATAAAVAGVCLVSGCGSRVLVRWGLRGGGVVWTSKFDPRCPNSKGDASVASTVMYMSSSLSLLWEIPLWTGPLPQLQPHTRHNQSRDSQHMPPLRLVFGCARQRSQEKTCRCHNPHPAPPPHQDSHATASLARSVCSEGLTPRSKGTKHPGIQGFWPAKRSRDPSPLLGQATNTSTAGFQQFLRLSVSGSTGCTE